MNECWTLSQGPWAYFLFDTKKSSGWSWESPPVPSACFLIDKMSRLNYPLQLWASGIVIIYILFLQRTHFYLCVPCTKHICLLLPSPPKDWIPQIIAIFSLLFPSGRAETEGLSFAQSLSEGKVQLLVVLCKALQAECHSKEDSRIQIHLPCPYSHPALFPDLGSVHLNLKSTSMTLMQKRLWYESFMPWCPLKTLCLLSQVSLHFQSHVVGNLTCSPQLAGLPAAEPPCCNCSQLMGTSLSKVTFPSRVGRGGCTKVQTLLPQFGTILQGHLSSEALRDQLRTLPQQHHITRAALQ